MYDEMDNSAVKPVDPTLSTKSKWQVDNFVNRLFDDAQRKQDNLERKRLE
jgi:hypothetical protein